MDHKTAIIRYCFYNASFFNCYQHLVAATYMERELLLHYFDINKNAAKGHRILVEVYGEHALADQTCRKWYECFKSDIDLDDKEQQGTITTHKKIKVNIDNKLTRKLKIKN